MRRLFALTSILLLAACSKPLLGTNDQGSHLAGSVPALSKLAGRTESQLIAGMGRAPDSTYQADSQTRILKWRDGTPPETTPTKYYQSHGANCQA